jgi:hypothetical protein
MGIIPINRGTPYVGMLSHMLGGYSIMCVCFVSGIWGVWVASPGPWNAEIGISLNNAVYMLSQT